MNLKLTLAASALALFGGVAANALPISIVFDNPNITLPASGPVIISGTLTNTSSNPISIDSDSVAVPSDIGVLKLLPIYDPMGPATLDLAANGGSFHGNLFQLTIPSTEGPFTGHYAVDSGDNTSDDPLGFATFTATNPNAVPEPGTVALLVTSGLMGGGLLVARRRRK